MTQKILLKATSLGQALQIKTMLEANGIVCNVHNINSHTIFSYMANPRVWVAEEDYENAKKLLDSHTVENISTTDSSSPEAVSNKRIMGFAVLGFMIPVIPNLYSLYLQHKSNKQPLAIHFMAFLVNLSIILLGAWFVHAKFLQ